jgi:hypothetical protein
VAPNSYSPLPNKTFLLKKVSPMNLAAAHNAELPANNRTMAAVAITNSVKCLTLPALNAVHKLKFLSVQAMTVRFIAEIASVKTKGISSLTPLLLQRSFLFYIHT